MPETRLVPMTDEQAERLRRVSALASTPPVGRVLVPAGSRVDWDAYAESLAALADAFDGGITEEEARGMARGMTAHSVSTFAECLRGHAKLRAAFNRKDTPDDR